MFTQNSTKGSLPAILLVDDDMNLLSGMSRSLRAQLIQSIC
jgi:hypothetical protein